MDYPQILDYVFNRKQKGLKLGLERMTDLLNRLNHPQKTFSSIHIAGTNGKGSTASMIAAMLQAAGYLTGLYTSPHLIDLRERIQIQNQIISKPEIIAYLQSMQIHIEASEASFFEAITALAFCYFRDRQVDMAVVETGLGGRLDATNTLIPELAIITEIGLDHTEILGKTLKPIAFEKSGIFKPGIPCVVGSRNRTVNAYFQIRAEALGCPVRFSVKDIHFNRIRLTEQGTWVDVFTPEHRYSNLFLRLLGEHQLDNLATALLSVEWLMTLGWSIPETAIRRGLADVQWPARLQLLQTHPKILLDSAHNPMGMKRLAQSLKYLFTYKRLIFIFGVLADKDYRKMLKQIIPLADFLIFTQPLSERALPPHQLKSLTDLHDKDFLIIPDVSEAWHKALGMAKKEDLICGAGSIYFVGELLRFYQETQK